jgi:MFS family permease
MVLAGGFALLWAAIRARSRRKIIGWAFGIAVVMLLGGQLLAVLTGLASGEVEPSGWQWALVVASLAVYSLSIVAMGVGGLLLLRDLFKRPPLPTQGR